MIVSRWTLRTCAPLLIVAFVAATHSLALAADDKQTSIPICDK